MHVPDLFVIGAMKSGTTSFYDLYFNGAAFNLTRRKEHNGFVNFDNPQGVLSSYAESYRSTKGIKCDVSPKYAQRHLFPNVPEKIFSLNKSAKIIYVVRDPIERIQSHVYHDMLRDRLKAGDLDQVLLKDQNTYLKTSAYFYQIAPYVKNFGTDRILILNLEEFENPDYNIDQRIGTFLDLPEYQFPSGKSYESVSRYKIPFHDYVHATFGNGMVARLYHSFFYLMAIKPKKPFFSEELLQKIKMALTTDIEQFIELGSINSKTWKTYQSISIH